MGGSKVHKSRSNFSGPTDGSNVGLYRDYSTARILNQRRRLTAMLDMLDGIDRDGISLSGCLEHGAPWKKVLSNCLARPMVPGDLVQRPGDGDSVFFLFLFQALGSVCTELLLDAETPLSGVGDIGLRRNLVVALVSGLDLIFFLHLLFSVKIQGFVLEVLVF